MTRVLYRADFRKNNDKRMFMPTLCTHLQRIMGPPEIKSPLRFLVLPLACLFAAVYIITLPFTHRKFIGSVVLILFLLIVLVAIVAAMYILIYAIIHLVHLSSKA